MVIDLHTLWLMWIIIGAILLLVELFTTTFFALWMAGAAIVPAILSFIYPNVSLEFQIIVWIIAMCICAFLWMRFSKRDTPLENIDKELIGQIGILAKKCDAENKGILLLQKPVDGLSQWECVANYPIPMETRVVVIKRIDQRLLQVDFEKK
ncbi:Membrane protein implicated in regulation of membrane protease activity (YbbJ) (PDB:2EXD) [Commensalibacter communis]|uniref:NfeD family protein n=1 Tax=Commensalibacter communis TaxID=2972786 RepID=UPI0022FF7B7C|nr:NfeD family protein [Commensalibacter communis]CAI3928747.1 Membrane protein implicated in regulation of membrane protease activity (YbbJ) (PDB:2EXD) [Commensalibacter communis]